MTEKTKKTAIVTGGTSGIGLATCKALLRSGANLIVNARQTSDSINDLEKLAAKHTSRVVFVAGDMRDAETSASLATAALDAFGSIDIVVHAAGGPAPGHLADMPEADWRDAFDVHVHSAFHLFRATVEPLRASRGAVVLLSSTAALRGCPGNTAYQVCKAALIQMTRALARDYAAAGLRINCVAPGIIRTPFQAFMTEEARVHNITNRIPLGREGRPDEVASMIMQLVENEFITGETMVIDGGMSMRVA